jgi:hypothetical protein
LLDSLNSAFLNYLSNLNLSNLNYKIEVGDGEATFYISFDFPFYPNINMERIFLGARIKEQFVSAV